MRGAVVSSKSIDFKNTIVPSTYPRCFTCSLSWEEEIPLYKTRDRNDII